MLHHAGDLTPEAHSEVHAFVRAQVLVVKSALGAVELDQLPLLPEEAAQGELLVVGEDGVKVQKVVVDPRAGEGEGAVGELAPGQLRALGVVEPEDPHGAVAGVMGGHAVIQNGRPLP